MPAAMARARAIGADRVELYTEPYARRCGTPRQAERRSRAFAAAARGRAARRPRRQRRPRPQPRQPRRLPRRRARRARGLDRPRADRRRARARHGRDGARLPALHARIDAARAAGAMIFGIGTDICDIRRIRAVAGAARRPLRRARPRRRTRSPSSAPAAPQLEARGVRYLATRFSAKEAFSKAIGLGMRMPMTWRGCEIVNAAERQARDPPARRARRLVRGARPDAPTSASPTKPTTRRASSSSNRKRVDERRAMRR